MTIGQFLSVLRARWWVVLGVLLLVVLGTLAVNMAVTRQYTASASVVVDFKPDPVSAFAFGGMASPGYMATQVDIIRSDRVARRVVRLLRLNEDPGARRQWQEETGGQGSIEDWFGGLFQRNLDVVPSRESSVITVSYRAPNPNNAAALANAFMQAYLDTALELRTDPAQKYSSFFEKRSKEARDALEKAQGKLSEFQKSNGIIATDERLDVENARLNELSSQLTALQALASESASRQAQAQGAQSDRLPEVLNNPLVTQLRSEVGRTEASLQQLSTRFGDNHPQVIEARASLAELREKLSTELRRATGSVGVTNTINRQREVEVRSSLAEQRAKVLRMKQVRDEGLLLLQDVANAQRAYDAVIQRFTQTNLESQNTQANINVLTQASAPSEPSSPRVVYNTLIAAFAGALGGLLLAFGWELFDRRVRSLDDVAVSLGLPVLGVMPKPGAKWRRVRTPALQQQLMAASLPAPGKSA
jgi:polysaccharide biosynthesis transport protein